MLSHTTSCAASLQSTLLCCSVADLMLCHTLLMLVLLQSEGWAVLLQTYGNLTTEAGLDELASYATGMGPDKGAYILNISSSKTLHRCTNSSSLLGATIV